LKKIECKLNAENQRIKQTIDSLLKKNVGFKVKANTVNPTFSDPWAIL
jgi:hypothetical protein